MCFLGTGPPIKFQDCNLIGRLRKSLEEQETNKRKWWWWCENDQGENMQNLFITPLFAEDGMNIYQDL